MQVMLIDKFIAVVVGTQNLKQEQESFLVRNAMEELLCGGLQASQLERRLSTREFLAET